MIKNTIPIVLFASISAAQPTITANPTSGELGSVIQLTVTPQTAGYELTQDTTGVWFGNYSSSGGTTPLFTTTYADASITIVDDWNALLILGTGETVSKSGDIDATTAALLAPNGTLNGSFQLITPNPCAPDLNQDGNLNFFDVSAFLVAYANEEAVADFNDDGLFNFFDVSAFLTQFNTGCGATTVELEAPISMSFTAEPAKWHSMFYPGGWTSGVAPELIEEISGDLVILPSSTMTSIPTDDGILAFAGSIYAVTLDIESNVYTDAGQPASLYVDVFSVDSLGNEIDRVQSLELQHEGVVGTRVRYNSLNAKNILLTDSPVDDSTFTEVFSLQADDNGMVFVVIHLGV